MFRYDSLQSCSNYSGNESMLHNNISESVLLDGELSFFFFFLYLFHLFLTVIIY